MATEKTTATKTDVQKMSSKERLWQDLGTKYDQAIEESNKSYEQGVAQTGRDMLKKGIQRSSYGQQVQAGLRNQGVEAANKLQENKMAAYASGLNDLEAREAQEAIQRQQIAVQASQVAAQRAATEANLQFQREQLAWQKEQYEKELEYKISQAALDRAFTTSEREATQGYNTSERIGTQQWQSGENTANRQFTASEREATQAYNTGEREATQAYNTGERIAQQFYNTSEREATQAYQSGENAASRAFQTSEREATQAYQSGENAASRAFQTSEREATQAYNTSERESSQAYNTSERESSQAFQADQNAIDRAFEQKKWDDTQAQWREQFDYGKMSDDQKIAYNYVTQIIANGNDPSDDLLNRAGLSRSDANAMKTKAATTGSGNPPKADTRPDWEKAGFSNDADYKEALSRGMKTPEQLREFRERILTSNNNTTTSNQPSKLDKGTNKPKYTI